MELEAGKDACEALSKREFDPSWPGDKSSIFGEYKDGRGLFPDFSGRYGRGSVLTAVGIYAVKI